MDFLNDSRNDDKDFLALGIESSCDDTSIALVESSGFVRGMISQDQNSVHEVFGGVVPEIASRNHCVHMLSLINKLLESQKCNLNDIDLISVTSRPGLMGSLLVGVMTAQGLSLALDKPLIGVNHLEGHLLAPFLEDHQYTPPKDWGYPYGALAVSGGHTQIYRISSEGHYVVLGKTKDDAAGEVFDKLAKAIGLGFPGGAQVDQLAQKGDPQFISFPRPLLREDNFEMSFSGLKSAAFRYLAGQSSDFIYKYRADICASFQAAVVDVLVTKMERARKIFDLKYFVVTGGVSANSSLRKEVISWGEKKGVSIAIPPLRYCTDNGAMIGFAGMKRWLRAGRITDPLLENLGLGPQSHPGDFVIHEN